MNRLTGVEQTDYDQVEVNRTFAFFQIRFIRIKQNSVLCTSEKIWYNSYYISFPSELKFTVTDLTHVFAL